MKITGRTAAAIAASIEPQLTSAAGSLPLLPPVRVLASRLGVSPATVASAYRLLRDRGLVAGDRRRGTRRVQPAGLTDSRTPVNAGDVDITDLSNGLPDPLLVPEPHLGAIPTLPHDAGPVDASLITFASAEFEVDGVPADHLLVAAGALDAIERILWEDLRPGDRVAVEDPGSPEVRDLIVTAGFVPVPVHLDSEGADPDSLNDAIQVGCRAAIVSPRAQNPTGAAITPARAESLRRTLRRAPDLLLIENDYAAPIAGVGYQPLCTSAERWAVVRSTSKFLGPDLRLALVAGDRLTIGRVRQRQALGARWTSRIIQRLVLAVWSDPAAARRLARAAEIYAHRRTALQRALADQGLTTMAQSGFNLWLPVREEAAAVLALRGRGWLVAAGERFRMRSGPGLRVTTSALDEATATQFARDVGEVLPRSHAYRA